MTNTTKDPAIAICRHQLIEAMNTIIFYMKGSAEKIGENTFQCFDLCETEDYLMTALRDDDMDVTCRDFFEAIKEHGDNGFQIYGDITLGAI